MTDPLIVVVGPSASGKSEVAMQLAKRYGGEIICADARTIYKGMDIGTAKPSRQDQAEVRHHLLDITDVDNPITVADFSKLTQKTISSITASGHLPIVAGGSGMYIDSLIYNFTFANKPDWVERQRLQLLTVDELQEILKERSIPLPFNERNPRHLIRHIETYGQLGERGALRDSTLILGLAIDKELLKVRIAERANLMFQYGLENEVRSLVDQYGWDNVLSQTIGYQEFRPYFDQEANINEVKRAIVSNTNKLAKRQRTWFKRNKDIKWTDDIEKVEDIVTTFLNT